MAKTKYTIDEIEDALRHHKGFIAKTAEALGMTYHGVRKRIRNSKRLQAVAEEERENFLDLAEFKLFSNVNLGHQRAIEFVLRTKGQDRGYVERQDHGVFTPENKSVVMEHRVRGVEPSDPYPDQCEGDSGQDDSSEKD